MKEPEIIKFLSEYGEDLAKNNNFSGIIFFSRNAEILFNQAYGLANRSYNIQNTLETRFNMASCSKMFTAVAIGKLIEEKKLSFDDSVDKYLNEEWISSEIAKKISITHLLTHTSGLGLYWDNWDCYSSTTRILNDYKKIISVKLTFEPGTNSAYSNTGFILLGAIIEKITGKSYYDYIQELIFDPCNMHDTGYFELDFPHPNMATGYFEDKESGGKLKHNTFMFGVRGGASDGGAWSTASDMHQFILNLRANKLISENIRKNLWTQNGLFPEYGYGFQMKDNWIGHWGGFDGFEAFVFYYPKTDDIFLVFSNYWDSSLRLIKETITKFQDL